MKKTVLALVLCTSFAFAQETTEEKQGWTKGGNFSFLANQSTFNNWLAGGQSNMSGNIGANYDFNYKAGNVNWDNKLIVAYGLSKIKGVDTQKTDDRIEFNSLYGKKAKGHWFYSAFLNFKTQMDTGLDPDNQTVKVSHFFSPAFLQVGPGMLWKKSDNLKVNIAPATSKLIVVHDHFTEFGSSFGVEQGKTTRYELGASLGAYYKFDLMANVTFENILNLYSNYLEDPQYVDVDYQLNIVLKVNKYLSTNFAFQAIYDENALSEKIQTRQVIGVGVNYAF